MTTTQHTRTVDSQRAADPTRRAATIVGWLFIVTYVTSISAKIGFYPPLFDGNYVTGPGEDSRVLWGAFAEAILIIANIGTATALYTVVKHRYPNLGLSFIAARIMESVFIGVGILAVLTVVTLRQDYAAADQQSAAGLAAVGDAFLVMQEWTFNLGPGVRRRCRQRLHPRLDDVPIRAGAPPARRARPHRRPAHRRVRLRGRPRPHRARWRRPAAHGCAGVLLGARSGHLPHREGLQDSRRGRPGRPWASRR